MSSVVLPWKRTLETFEYYMAGGGEWLVYWGGVVGCSFSWTCNARVVVVGVYLG